MDEIRKVPYAEHLGYQMTITTIRSQHFLPGMKKYIVKYLSRCIECHKSKYWDWTYRKIASSIVDTIVEMGCGDNSFHHQIIEDSKTTWINNGSGEQVDKGLSLNSNQVYS